jgi:hypothetical protein
VWRGDVDLEGELCIHLRVYELDDVKVVAANFLQLSLNGLESGILGRGKLRYELGLFKQWAASSAVLGGSTRCNGWISLNTYQFFLSVLKPFF